MALVRRCAFYDGWQLAHAAVAGLALSRDMNAANDFDGLTSSGAGTGLESVSEYPPLGAVKADTAKGLEDSGLELRRLRKLARAYQMVTGLSIEITPEQKVVATMENEKHSDRCIQVTINLLHVSHYYPNAALAWQFELDIDEDSDEVEYAPLRISGLRAGQLPDHFHETITFATSQCPALYQQALSALTA